MIPYPQPDTHGGVHGTDEAAVYKELCEVVAETIELYAAD